MTTILHPRTGADRAGEGNVMLHRDIRPGLHVVRFPRNGVEELFVTATPPNGEEDLGPMFDRSISAARSADAAVLGQDVFGIPAERRAGHEALSRICDEPSWPVTWLEEGASQGERLTGTHLQAISGVEIAPIRLDGRTVGTVFEDGQARWCRLGDLRTVDTALSRERQARQVFDQMERALAVAGMAFDDIARTWLYIDDILSWYDEFNAVRNAFFRERRVFDGLVPASTGIGGSNAGRAAVIADALAVRPLSGAVKTFAVPSPLQCPALSYGSSFSRAVEIDGPGWRRLLVSGTASIEPGGKTAHVGDVNGQVALTMEVVKAILDAQKMGWGDVTRAIAYVRNGADAPAFTRFCAAKGPPPMPVVIAENYICRDDLLFEIELDAVVNGS